MKLSLIIPCYNEEGNILPLYRKTISVFRDRLDSYEFIFVNDGSGDRTQAILTELVRTADVPVKAISFSRNFGKEAAIFAGLHAAKGDCITLMDADLQQSPELVLDMVQYLDTHPDCDCVTACQEHRNENPVLVFCKFCFYKIMNRISETNFVDGASDFRTFRRNVADSVLSLSEYHRFSKGLFEWVGFNTHYIPYTADDRLSGTSKWSFFKLWHYAVEGILAFSTVPLRIPTVLGMGSVGISLGMTAVHAAKRTKGPADQEARGRSTERLILLMGGLQLTAIGIAGEYLARMYVQVKDRPVYIVRSVLSNEPESDDGDGPSDRHEEP